MLLISDMTCNHITVLVCHHQDLTSSESTSLMKQIVLQVQKILQLSSHKQYDQEGYRVGLGGMVEWNFELIIM